MKKRLLVIFLCGLNQSINEFDNLDVPHALEIIHFF